MSPNSVDINVLAKQKEHIKLKTEIIFLKHHHLFSYRIFSS